MNAEKIDPVAPLSTDIVPFLTDRRARVIVVRIVDVQWARRTEPDGDVEIGVVTLDVLNIIHGAAPQVGDRIEVHARRMADFTARARSNFDQWNVLALLPGDLLLMACTEADAPHVYRALAADPISSVVDPEVKAAQQVYVIEALPKDRRGAALEEALQSDQRLLRYYALDVIERRGDLGRQRGAEAIAHAVESPRVAPDVKLDLGVYLTHQAFFDKHRGADPSNTTVVAALSRAMIADSDFRRQLQWARFLASVLLVEFSPVAETDRALRTELVRAALVPSEEVMRTLTSLVGRSSEGDREIVADLIDAYRTASTRTP